ncbi:hypothetical protein O6H91_18G008700 [Diphasiastrum complanatum]|uniref:Uncharacterized protein n=3 Tax=Diphasiastrum complanatum TaxID=34168 RepID=A0ACC2AY73_DIPCM|nr:hypothetical protein O6H91_18G008700 [Diphasiastrum complanatum]KAJ7522390.1 hypothetical protein O6H91_18G008700 [Diphasiastrum complanatum]KAJ7522391.1 hypothetical protein O6H91_18G008700 [Diphasiastrum complanatum]
MASRAFYSWVAEKYPLILVDAVSEEPQGNPNVTDELNRPNPNGLEYDNLYVDMKWIIRSCFCPEAKPVPTTFEEIFQHIYDYIDQLYAIVRPRKLLYLAIDGVLPRSKMNLHRARCFQAAKAAILSSKEEKLSKELQTIGEMAPLKKVNEVWDPNVAAPGTEFMASLTVAVKYYIRLRINHDPGWHNIKVIFSDASVPGDGKHKIMSYIRLQRNLPGYDANIRHCLFGLDADSLMLALATHEVHFSILHEAVVRRNKLSFPSQHGHLAGVSNVDRKTKQDTVLDKGRRKFTNFEKPYQFLQLWILREYLEDDLHIPDALFKIDFERLIDDFVFMCFLAGSDFLPQMPILEIQEEAMTLLMDIYKKEFMKMGGYLTETGEANLRRIEHFIQAIGSLENDPIQKQVYLSKVKTAELGWKKRYYAANFPTHTTEAVEELKKELVLKYIEGLCWILRYYYQGICSWQWYYPYHCAPFASDLKDLDDLEITFFLGKPFKPFDHLMGLLPVASANVLPEAYSRLITDPNSPISDFYLQDFEDDTDGKGNISWDVARLPFIDESRLLAQTSKIEQTLMESERRRNYAGSDFLFLSRFHPLASYIIALYASNEISLIYQNGTQMKEIDPVASEGVNGFVALCVEDACPSTVVSHIEGMANISNNNVLCVLYKCPPNHRHIARPMAGVVMPKKVVIKKDTTLEFPRSLVSDIKDLDDKSRQLLQKELKAQAVIAEASSHHSKQALISGCEGDLLGIPSREPSPQSKLSVKFRRAGPPGFEHVVPASVSSTVPTNFSPMGISNGNHNTPKTLPSLMDNPRPSMMLSQHHTEATELRSVSPVFTGGSSPNRNFSGNVRVPPLSLNSAVSQVASNNRSPNRNLVQGYNIPTYIPSSIGSSVVPGNSSPKKNAIRSYTAKQAMAASQGGRSIPQYPSFTPSSTISSMIPSANVSPNKNMTKSQTRTVEPSEFLGACSVSQYPRSMIPASGDPNAHHQQMMHRPPPTGHQGFSGFALRGGPEAQHMPMSPLGHPQHPGAIPPHPWNTEREVESSPAPYFAHSQQIGAGHYTVMDNRPGRGRGMGIRHPNTVFH